MIDHIREDIDRVESGPAKIIVTAEPQCRDAFVARACFEGGDERCPDTLALVCGIDGERMEFPGMRRVAKAAIQPSN